MEEERTILRNLKKKLTTSLKELESIVTDTEILLTQNRQKYLHVARESGYSLDASTLSKCLPLAEKLEESLTKMKTILLTCRQSDCSGAVDNGFGFVNEFQISTDIGTSTVGSPEANPAVTNKVTETVTADIVYTDNETDDETDDEGSPRPSIENKFKEQNVVTSDTEGELVKTGDLHPFYDNGETESFGATQATSMNDDKSGFDEIKFEVCPGMSGWGVRIHIQTKIQLFQKFWSTEYIQGVPPRYSCLTKNQAIFSGYQN